MIKKLIILFVIVLFAFSFFRLLNPSLILNSATPGEDVVNASPTPPENTLPFRASFAIFTNGTFRVFTDPRYHRLSADVYLDSPSPNVINVAKSEVTWANFFATLPMALDSQCLKTGTGQSFCTSANKKLSFYLNGVENPLVLEQLIQSNDSLLITYGNLSTSELSEQLSRIPAIE